MGQGEFVAASQEPDKVPGNPAREAATDAASGNAGASLPEAGAQCGSSARWDLRGGRRATSGPTATPSTELVSSYLADCDTNS